MSYVNHMIMKKPVYSIGMVSRMLGVHPRMLRIYEKEGLISPKRIGGKRFYTEEDVQKLKCIRVLLEEGINIAGVRRLFEVAPCWRVLKCPNSNRNACVYYKSRGRFKMRIAFATEAPGGLEAEVAPHFRGAPYFTFVEVDEDGEIVDVDVVENAYVNIHGPGLLPSFVKRHGADVVVAGGMGQKAAILFQQEGIEPVAGAQGKVIDVLRAVIFGERFDGSLCDHKEHRDSCGKH